MIKAHELEKQNQDKKLQAVEEDLLDAKQQLENANSQIECKRAEVSKLETVCQDLEAQLSLLTAGLEEKDVKGFNLYFYVV